MRDWPANRQAAGGGSCKLLGRLALLIWFRDVLCIINGQQIANRKGQRIVQGPWFGLRLPPRDKYNFETTRQLMCQHSINCLPIHFFQNQLYIEQRCRLVERTQGIQQLRHHIDLTEQWNHDRVGWKFCIPGAVPTPD